MSMFCARWMIASSKDWIHLDPWITLEQFIHWRTVLYNSWRLTPVLMLKDMNLPMDKRPGQFPPGGAWACKGW
jgi:hypothetical protein